MRISMLIPPTLEPLTLTQVKDYLNVDDDSEDALISSLIAAARSYVEEFTQRPLCSQTKILHADYFEKEIPLSANLLSVDVIRYRDTDGVQQVLPDTEYDVDIWGQIGSVRPATGVSWPAVLDQLNAVEIEFTAGYGYNMRAAVPEPIKAAMLLFIGHLFLNRESVTVGVSVNETPHGVDLLLNFYRIMVY